MVATKVCQEKLGSFSYNDLKFCPLCHLKKKQTQIQKEDISIKDHSIFKENVHISVKASEISPNVEEGFDVNPSSYG